MRCAVAQDYGTALLFVRAERMAWRRDLSYSALRHTPQWL